jgi:hypothetical protein
MRFKISGGRVAHEKACMAILLDDRVSDRVLERATGPG